MNDALRPRGQRRGLLRAAVRGKTYSVRETGFSRTLLSTLWPSHYCCSRSSKIRFGRWKSKRRKAATRKAGGAGTRWAEEESQEAAAADTTNTSRRSFLLGSSRAAPGSSIMQPKMNARTDKCRCAPDPHPQRGVYYLAPPITTTCGARRRLRAAERTTCDSSLLIDDDIPQRSADNRKCKDVANRAIAYCLRRRFVVWSPPPLLYYIIPTLVPSALLHWISLAPSAADLLRRHRCLPGERVANSPCCRSCSAASPRGGQQQDD